MTKRWDEGHPEKTRMQQVLRLRAFLKTQILPFSTHYRKKLEGFDLRNLRRPEDLARLPFTTKEELLPDTEAGTGPRDFILTPSLENIRRHAPWDMKLRLGWRRLLHGSRTLQAELLREYNPTKIFFTTGRSASSIPFFLTPVDQELLRLTGRRIVQVLGLNPQGDKVLSFFPCAPHLAFWQVAACAEAGGILTVNTGGGRAMGGTRILEFIDRLKPTTLVGMPGYAWHLLRLARDRSLDLSSVRLVALGGEAVLPALKERIVTLLESMGARDPRVVSVFGFTEARQCWTECPGAMQTGFHLSSDLSLVEIIDPESGAVLPDGASGELVYTSLAGRGSAMLRYRTGDLIEGGLTWERCPGCGRRLPRLSSLVRRVSNMKNLELSRIKGTWVNFNTLGELLQEIPGIEEWQIVLGKRSDDPFEVDELTLHLAVTRNTSAATLIDTIQRRARAQAEIQFNHIRIHNLDDMLRRLGMETEPKENRILDNRPSPVCG